MTARGLVGWLGVVLVAGGAGQAGAQAPEATPAPSAALAAEAASTPRALLDRYCVACHNDRTRQAGLTLQSIDSDRVGHVAGEVEAWEKVVRKLRGRAMPPPGRPRPEPAAYDAAAHVIETALDAVAAADP
ncbi:MAG: hypothetical protein OXG35_27950, partial [Acidobacteria bacterium]|nr:hypothetical protein [Acidobacteriota bacterium]